MNKISFTNAERVEPFDFYFHDNEEAARYWDKLMDDAIGGEWSYVWKRDGKLVAAYPAGNNLLMEEKQMNDDDWAKAAEAARDRDTEAFHGGDDRQDQNEIEKITPDAFYMDAGDYVLPENVYDAKRFMQALKRSMEWQQRSKGKHATAYTFSVYTTHLAELGEMIMEQAIHNGITTEMLSDD